MTEALVEFLQQAVASPWFYIALFAFSAIDGFVPMVPSETLVITAGVFATTGDTPLIPIVLTAAAGAFVGDHISYLIGHTAGDRVLGLLRRTRRGRVVVDWAQKALGERGPVILIVARYVPGGRTAVTMSAGALRYPLRVFTPCIFVAATTWATYSALVGYLGGRLFEQNPVLALAAGLGFGLAVAAVVELVRHLLGRRATVTLPGAPAEDSDPVGSRS